MIDEIEQKIINILPTSNTMFDEIDYSILEKRKEDWIKLSEITHSIVLVFDCYTNKFVFVSDNIPKLYGVDSRRLFVDGHRQVIELIHPDDIDYGLLDNIQIIFAMPTIFYVSKLIIPLYQSLLYRTPWNQNIKNKNNCGLYAENAYFCPKGQ